MSSTEPPSRNAPRSQPHETKSARDELSSKGKVEKVREVDPDEETRKQKFQKYYKGETDEDKETTQHPSPFDLASKEPKRKGPLAPKTPSAFSDAEDAIVPEPSYTSPPGVGSFEGENPVDDEATEGALPQAENFWSGCNLPDEPKKRAQFQENGTPSPKKANQDPTDDSITTGPNSKAATEAQHAEKKAKKKQDDLAIGTQKSAHAEKEKLGAKIKKESAPSLSTPPGKTTKNKEPLEIDQSKQMKKESFEPEEISSAPLPKEELPGQTGKDPHEKTSKTRGAQKADEQEGQIAIPIKPESQDQGSKEGQKRQSDVKPLEIEQPSLPPLPASVQPAAMQAATGAAPQLNPSTVPLFFQMVGMMYVMAGPKGVSRTEVVLNNPSFSNSKFFGSTITIEKYATAPDSFNIRLSGSPEAVTSFNQNIPSLMNAFQNGNFGFKVARIDVEHRTDRPVFHRKERGADQRDAGGGDLGERRK